MALLALDTCLGAVSVALAWRTTDGQSRKTARYELCRAGHAERLMPMIAEVMAEANLPARDLHRIAVTLGPGTFTGVRTGIAAARGLALAAGVEVVGTSSLAVIAAGLVPDMERDGDTTRIAVAVDARKGDVFFQQFDPTGAALTEAELLPLADAAAKLTGGRWHLAGSASTALSEAALTLGTEIGRCEPDREPKAQDLARIAGALPPLVIIAPLYIRAPDALPQSGKALPRAAP